MFIKRNDLCRCLGAILAGVLVLLVGVIFLPGCSSSAPAKPILAADNEARLAWLSELGWQVEEQPLESLHLQLPDPLDAHWSDYARQQEEMGLPFSSFAGKTVERLTYRVRNYPQRPDGVQLNLFICDEQIIGGDTIGIGPDGFQAGLAFPET